MDRSRLYQWCQILFHPPSLNYIIKMKRFLIVSIAIVLFTGLSAQERKTLELSAEVGAIKGVGAQRHDVALAAFNLDFRLSKLSILGIGAGAGITDGTFDKIIFPLYFRMKFYFLEAKISPFFLMNIGYTFSSDSKPGEGFGVMFAPSVGADFSYFKRRGLYATLGTNNQSHVIFNKIDLNSAYLNKFLWGPEIRIGYRF